MIPSSTLGGGTNNTRGLDVKIYWCLTQLQQQLFVNQIIFTSETDECGICEYLMNCTSRNVLTYMEDRNITECMLPKVLFVNHC